MPMNMSYCRFENTLEALRECVEQMSDSMDPLSELSKSERKAAEQLIKLCRNFASDFED